MGAMCRRRMKTGGRGCACGGGSSPQAAARGAEVAHVARQARRVAVDVPFLQWFMSKDSRNRCSVSSALRRPRDAWPLAFPTGSASHGVSGRGGSGGPRRLWPPSLQGHRQAVGPPSCASGPGGRASAALGRGLQAQRLGLRAGRAAGQWRARLPSAGLQSSLGRLWAKP